MHKPKYTSLDIAALPKTTKFGNYPKEAKLSRQSIPKGQNNLLYTVVLNTTNPLYTSLEHIQSILYSIKNVLQHTATSLDTNKAAHGFPKYVPNLIVPVQSVLCTLQWPPPYTQQYSEHFFLALVALHKVSIHIAKLLSIVPNLILCYFHYLTIIAWV